MKRTTPRQAKALRFIRDCLRLHDLPPSMEEVARHLGISPPAAYDLIVRMERAGLVHKTPGKPRSVVPTMGYPDLEREAKAIVLLAFRNGPIEDVHAGRPCPNCSGQKGYSHITDDEMKRIMKAAVDRVFTLLALKSEQPDRYEGFLTFATLQTKEWDSPQRTSDF